MTEQEILKQLEKRISKEYKDTEAVIREKIAYFTKDFDKENKKYQQMVKDSKISKTDYKNWYRDQMFAKKWSNKMVSEISSDLAKTTETASKIINNDTSKVYLQGIAEASKELESYDDFTVFDTRQLKRIADKNAKHLPKANPNIPKEERWNEKRIKSALMQSAIKGESVQKLAGRLKVVVGMGRTSAIRNARTMMTASHNMGKLDLGNEAVEMGIKVRKKWIATFDNRTRDSHALLHGEIVDMDEEFSNGLMFPADPDGDPAEVYNCRCTMALVQDEEKTKGISKDEFDQRVEENEARKEEFRDANRELKNQQTESQEKKFEFTPATTLEDAEKYANQFVDNSMFGAVGVSYKGISVDVANEVNKTVGKFYTIFNVEKFGGIIAPASNTKLGKQIQDATAGFSPIRRSIFLNRNSMKNMKVATEKLKKEHDVITDILQHPEKYDLTKASKVLNRIVDNSRLSGRGTIPETIEEAINHELGHSLEKQIKNHNGWSTVIENMPKFNQKLSGYACEDQSEYIAESFCSYMKGEKNTDPELVKIFESLKR